MRIHTSIVAAIVTLAFAGPAVAGTQAGPYLGTMPTAGSATATQTSTETGQTFVTSVHVGTSAISGDCLLTETDDTLWSYDCPAGGTVNSNTTVQGVTTAQAPASSIPGNCVLTMIDGYAWGYDCPSGTVGSNAKVQTTAQAPTGSCTLTVAAGHFWTYSCPGGKSGTSKGAIPTSCKASLETGYLWMFKCPSKAFAGSSTTVKAAPKGKAGTATGTLRSCAGTLTDRRLSGLLCIL